MGLTTGSRFGPYEILSQLGQGGMGEVYLVRRTGPGGFVREVVIKRVLPGLDHDRTFVNTFLDEAAILARLTNIAQVYDFGELDGQHYLVMEYVRDASLAQLTGAVNARSRSRAGACRPGTALAMSSAASPNEGAVECTT
jgi:eukaryotic-like serine/threonine-protein kinase